MNWLIIFTYKQLLVVIVMTVVLLAVGNYLIIKLWAKDRFKNIEDRTNSIEDLEERTASLEYSRDVDVYGDKKDGTNDD